MLAETSRPEELSLISLRSKTCLVAGCAHLGRFHLCLVLESGWQKVHVWLSSILVLGYCHLLKLGCHRSGSFPYLNWRIVADQHWVLLCFRRFYCFWTFACLIGHRLGSYCLWICSIGSHHLIISDNYLFGVMHHFSKLFLVYFCYSEIVPSSFVPVPDQDDLDLAGSYSCCTHLDQLSSFSSCFEIARHQLCLTSMNSIWPTTFFHHLVSLL